MNIVYITSIISVLLLLVFIILSIVKTNSLSFQIIYIVVAAFNIGVITSLILINYSNKSAMIWPVLLFMHVISKTITLRKHLKQLD
ncbi:MAG: hypothetical protein WCO54_04445 [Bacteroidota bacterium]